MEKQCKLLISFIKKKRKEKGMTQRQLQEKALGIKGHNVISGLETGRKKNITIYTLIAIYQALDAGLMPVDL